jgi:branched-chain amino acid transport system permease protein
MQLAIQNVINALLLGGFYSAVALGFSLVWGVMNVINLAHGAMIMLGAYATFWLFHLFGVDPFLSIPVSMVLLFCFGFGLQKLVINLVVRAPVFMVLILTFGLEIAIMNVSTMLWTANYRSVNPSYAGTGLDLGGVIVPYVRIAIFVIAFLLTFGMYLFLNRTKTGNAIKATGLDKEAAELMGVDIGRIYAITFAVSAAMAGAAGSLLVTTSAVNPYSGGAYTFIAALIVCLGGLGNIMGVVAGAFVVAFAETMGSYLISPGLKMFISFVLLVIILSVRPQGIMGKKFFAEVKH